MVMRDLSGDPVYCGSCKYFERSGPNGMHECIHKDSPHADKEDVSREEPACWIYEDGFMR
jgi:hypothetical protein